MHERNIVDEFGIVERREPDVGKSYFQAKQNTNTNQAIALDVLKCYPLHYHGKGVFSFSDGGDFVDESLGFDLLVEV